MSEEIKVLIGDDEVQAMAAGEYLSNKGITTKNIEKNPLIIQHETIFNKPDAVLICWDTEILQSLCKILKNLEDSPYIILIYEKDKSNVPVFFENIDMHISCGFNSEHIYRCLFSEIICKNEASNKNYDITKNVLNNNIISDVNINQGQILHNKITEILNRLCVSPRYNGYNCLREAIKIAVADNQCHKGISKQIYPEIAKMMNTAPSAVERSIRTAIHKSWNKTTAADRIEFFGVYAINNQIVPTNSEYIYIIADKLCCSLYGGEYPTDSTCAN